MGLIDGDVDGRVVGLLEVGAAVGHSVPLANPLPSSSNPPDVIVQSTQARFERRSCSTGSAYCTRARMLPSTCLGTVALRRWRRFDAGSMRKYSGTVVSAITAARRAKKTTAKGAVLPSGMKVVKSAKYSTITGFMYAGVGETDGGAVGGEVVGDVDGDVVGLAVVGDTVGEVVGFGVVGDTVGDAVGTEVLGDTVGEAVGEAMVGDCVGNTVGEEVVGEAVGETVGVEVVGDTDGEEVGTLVGLAVGLAVGFMVGFIVGCAVGSPVGYLVGFIVGFAVGTLVGFIVGLAVGFAVGFTVGFMVG